MKTHTHAHTHTLTVAETGSWYLLGRTYSEVFSLAWKGDSGGRGGGRAGSKVLWEGIPNVWPKARSGAKTMSLAFVLLDFQYAGVRRRAWCTRRDLDMFRDVSRTRTIYSIETQHMQATLYLVRSEMGSQNSSPRRGVGWWWRCAKRTSLAAKFWIFWRGCVTELGEPTRRHLQ